MQNAFFTDFLALSQPMTLGALALLVLSFFILKVVEAKKIDFSIRMLIGLGLGLLLGMLIQLFAGFPSAEVIKETVWLQETNIWYGLFGRSFVSFIRMLLIPIVLASMIRTIINLKAGVDIKALVGKTLFWLLATTGIAAAVGFLLAYFTNLGVGAMEIETSRHAREVTNIVDVLVELIPANPVTAMNSNNIVGVVIFAAFIGSSAKIMHSKEKYRATIDYFINLVEASYRIVMSMAMTVIKYMPYAVVALMARTLISNGLSAIQDAMKFIVLIYAAMFIMLFIHLVIVAAHGLNPITFAKKSFATWLMAFSSRSSVGSLPMTIATLENRLGVSPGTANFVGSLGSTAGMNGCAGYFPALVAVFIANMIGMPIDASFMVMVIVVAMLGSLGIAGIPGSATLAASIMLSGIGLSHYFPLLAIVLAIDPIIDMARTFSNVSGSMAAAIAVDKELGTIDTNVYNDPNAEIQEV